MHLAVHGEPLAGQGLAQGQEGDEIVPDFVLGEVFGQGRGIEADQHRPKGLDEAQFLFPAGGLPVLAQHQPRGGDDVDVGQQDVLDQPVQHPVIPLNGLVLFLQGANHVMAGGFQQLVGRQAGEGAAGKQAKQQEQQAGMEGGEGLAGHGRSFISQGN